MKKLSTFFMTLLLLVLATTAFAQGTPKRVIVADEDTKSTYTIGDYIQLADQTVITAEEGVAACEVLSENLVTNHSFELGFDGWCNLSDWGIIAEPNFEQDDTGAKDGEFYIYSTVDEGASGAGSLGRTWQLEAGKSYYFSYWVKSISGGVESTPYLVTSLVAQAGDNDAADNCILLDGNDTGNPKSVGADWQKEQIVFTVPEGTDYTILQIRFRWIGKKFAFDDFELYEADLCMDNTGDYHTNDIMFVTTTDATTGKEVETAYRVLSENMVENHSFELGYVNWYNANISYDKTTGDPVLTEISPSYFSLMKDGAADGKRYLVGDKSGDTHSEYSLFNYWPVDNGKSYVFSFDIKAQDYERTTAQFIKTALVNTLQDEDNGLLVDNGDGQTTPTTWKHVEVPFTNTDGYAYLQIDFRWLDGIWGFDNFQLYEVEETQTVSLTAHEEEYEIETYVQWNDTPTAATTESFSHWSNSNSTGGTFQLNTWSAYYGTTEPAEPWVEYWVANGSFLGASTISHETLVGMPAGNYTVSIYANANNESGAAISSSPTLKANGVSVDLLTAATTVNTAKSNYYGTYTLECEVGEDGLLDINFDVPANSLNWFLFKDLKIEYVGYDAPEVEYYKDDQPMDATLKTAMENAVDTYNASQTSADFEAAITAIQAAAVSVEEYAELGAVLATLDDAGLEVWETTTSATAYNNGTLGSANAADVSADLSTAVKSQTTAGSDMTYGLLNSGDWNVSSMYGTEAHERFNGATAGPFTAETTTSTTSNDEGKILYKTVTGLTPGTYEVTFYAAANGTDQRDGFTSNVGDNIAQIFANETTQDVTVIEQTACTPSDYEYTLTCVVDEDGVLEFGLQNIAAGGNWYVAQEVALTLLEATEAVPDTELEGDYLIVNVATGQYLSGGFDWSTKAGLLGKPQFMTLAKNSSGIYSIDSNQHNTGTWNDSFVYSAYPNVWVDNLSAQYEFTIAEIEEGSGVYTISCTAEVEGVSTKVYMAGTTPDAAIALEAATTKTDATTGKTTTTMPEGCEWQFISMDDILAEMADADGANKVDVTALVGNSNFKVYNDDEWTITKVDGTGTISIGQVGTDVVMGNNVAEAYHEAFDVSQEIELPYAGVYMLSAQGFYRNDHTDGTAVAVPVMYAGSEELALPNITTQAESESSTTNGDMGTAYRDFLNGLYPIGNGTINEIKIIAYEDGEKITIGFKGEDTNIWAAFGEVTLEYMGADIPDDDDYEVGDYVMLGDDTYEVVGENIIKNGGFNDASDGELADWTANFYSEPALLENFGYSATGGYNDGTFITILQGAGAESVYTPTQAIPVEVGKTYLFVGYTSGTAPTEENMRYSGIMQMNDDGTDEILEDGKTSGHDAVVEAQLEWGEGVDKNGDLVWTKTEKVFTASTPYVGLRMTWCSDASFDGMQLYEVEADVETMDGEYLIVDAEGNYLGGGLTWGTQAAIIGKPQFIGLEMQASGAYTLDSHQYNGADAHFLGSNLYFDSTPVEWTITEVEGGYTIYGTVDDGTGYLTSNGFQTVPTVEATPYVWSLVTMDDVVASMADASAETPVDATALIASPEMKRNSNTTYYPTWTVTGFDGTGTPSNYAFGGGSAVANCAESYHSTNGFDFSQEITLPLAGTYTLSAQGFYRDDNSETLLLPVMYAGDQSVEFPELDTSANTMAEAYAEFLEGLHPIDAITITAEEDGETVTIGFAGEDTSLWQIMGELTLLYYGGDEVPEPEPVVVHECVAEESHWTTDGTTVIGLNTWSVEEDASGMETPFLQLWVWSGDTTQPSLEAATVSHEQLTDLEPGTYEVSLDIRIFSEAGNEIGTGTTFNANKASADLLTEGSTGTYATDDYPNMTEVYGTYVLTCTVGEAGTLDISINIPEGVEYNWIAWKNLTVTYIGEAEPEPEGTYEFVAEDWVASDNGRAPQSSITYNSDGTITVEASGTNNIALGNNTSASWYPAPEPDVITTAEYTITADQIYFTVIGSNLSTDVGDSYMWWMNGWNEGSQIVPTYTYSLVDAEETMYVWDISAYVEVGEDGLITLDGGTCFGLTSLSTQSTISDINFYTADDIDAIVTANSGILTEIDSVDTEKVAEGIYTLSGVRISKITKSGIYIVDGKKVLVK